MSSNACSELDRVNVDIKNGQTASMNDCNAVLYLQTDSLLQDTIAIIDSARDSAYRSVNTLMVIRNWQLGHRISVENFNGKKRAEYGKKVMAQLAADLTNRYGRGFDASNLYKFLDFYHSFPQILDTASLKSIQLTWSHYRILLQEHDSKARQWYENEAITQMWSARTLQRNISSQYYQRMLLTQHRDLVEQEMHQLTTPLQNRLEFIKKPLVAEFLGLTPDSTFQESDLENAILSNLQRFLMELGKGYAFVARQQHIHTEKQDYYVDLVFYNYILKCFVLIDLKTTRITHQDVGQMDMYRRMYDELRKSEDDNPTLGLILCSDTDEDIARYSVLHDNEQLFATKYKLILPSEEELRAEIQAQKNIYLLQHTSPQRAESRNEQ